MQQPKLRFIGVELYFDDLETAKQFYRDTLHLEISNEQIGHHAKFGADPNFILPGAQGVRILPVAGQGSFVF